MRKLLKQCVQGLDSLRTSFVQPTGLVHSQRAAVHGGVYNQRTYPQIAGFIRSDFSVFYTRSLAILQVVNRYFSASSTAPTMTTTFYKKKVGSI